MYYFLLRLLTLLTPLLVALGLFIWQVGILSLVEAGFILLAALAGLLPTLFQPRHNKELGTVIGRLEQDCSLDTQRHKPLEDRLQAVEYQWQQTRTELENRLKGRFSILEQLPQPLVMLNSDLKLVRANFMGRQLFHLPDQENTGKTLSAIIRSTEILEAANRVNEQEISEVLEVEMDQRYYTVHVETLPVRPFLRTRVVIIFTDITAIRLNEQANANFVAHASHELRTPLTAIIGFIETLQGAAANDTKAAQHFLKMMYSESNRMRRLINDLLSLSKLDSTQPVYEKTDIVPIISNVIQLLSGQAQKRAMNIRFQHDQQAGFVHGNADLLTQVFQNLVDNAIRYGAKDSTIQIDLGQDDNDFIIDVINKGTGIARGEIAKLTNRFYRSSNANGIEGTGLGLAIVDQAIKRHNGRLVIDSEAGAWSRFRVVLPLIQDA